MSTKSTRDEKRSDSPIRSDRSYHDVPADWTALGGHESSDPDCDRFEAAKLCYERVLARDPTAVAGMTEHNDIHVLYEHPETGERVQRQYEASVIETDADALEVTTSAVEGDIGPSNWGTVAYTALRPHDGVAIVPRIVRHAEPERFRVSIQVHPDEPRVGE